jgi:hypothetical protein
MLKKLVVLLALLGFVCLALLVLIWRQQNYFDQADPVFNSPNFNPQTEILGPKQQELPGGGTVWVYTLSPVKLENLSRNWFNNSVQLKWQILLPDKQGQSGFSLNPRPCAGCEFAAQWTG